MGPIAYQWDHEYVSKVRAEKEGITYEDAYDKEISANPQAYEKNQLQDVLAYLQQVRKFS